MSTFTIDQKMLVISIRHETSHPQPCACPDHGNRPPYRTISRDRSIAEPDILLRCQVRHGKRDGGKIIHQRDLFDTACRAERLF